MDGDIKQFEDNGQTFYSFREIRCDLGMVLAWLYIKGSSTCTTYMYAFGVHVHALELAM